MKTRFFTILSVAAVMAMACSKNVDVEHVQQYEFSAMLEIPVKTSLAQDAQGKYTKMEWSENDKIGLFDASGKPQPFTTEQGGASAVFKGEASAPSDYWFAFYPYTSEAVKAGASGQENLRINIPEIQYAVKNGIADNVSVLVAKCAVGSSSLNFNHVCGYISINVPDGVVSVTIETEGTALSGSIGAYFSASNPWMTTFQHNSVTLVSSDGGPMSEGTYYMAVRPVNHTGKVLLSMRHNDGRISVKEADGLTVGRAQVRPINVNPVWMTDDGVSIYTEASDNKCNVSASNSTVTDVEDVKILGNKSTKWEIGTGKQGYFKLNASARFDLTSYKEGYALEYYIKAEPPTLGTSWELYYHDFAGYWVSNSYPGKVLGKAPVYGTAMTNSTYFGINDTAWHRISVPFDESLVSGLNNQYQMLELRLKGNSPAGNLFYIDDVRIVRKTPTVAQ